MDLKTYQQAVMQSQMTKPGTELLAYMALGLAGEAGEVANEVKKGQREGKSLDVLKFVDELGDTLWYLTRLAGMAGYSLPELASINMEKLKERHPSVYGHVRH